MLMKCYPMKFDAFYVSLLSEKYKTGAMNPLRAFWIGWRSNCEARKIGRVFFRNLCDKTLKINLKHQFGLLV